MSQFLCYPCDCVRMSGAFSTSNEYIYLFSTASRIKNLYFVISDKYIENVKQDAKMTI